MHDGQLTNRSPYEFTMKSSSLYCSALQRKLSLSALTARWECTTDEIIFNFDKHIRTQMKHKSNRSIPAGSSQVQANERIQRKDRNSDTLNWFSDKHKAIYIQLYYKHYF